MLAHASLGVGEEDVDGIARGYLFADRRGLDLVHVGCRNMVHAA